MAHRDDGAPRARAPEPADLARICRALNEHAARYVLIGGFAMIAHGAGRFTKDIDLLVDDAPEDVAHVRQALSILEDNAAADVSDNDVRDHVVVRVIDDVMVVVASPATLIKTKNTYRPQDALDRAYLNTLLEQ